ncbi:glycosyltransferase family 4 protein [Candidatus Gottesmanbacteria bacterium]|nr:glycosyltransferase family 4 protein [Candidatus Gottesmanbacteria bacterium]
MVAMDRGIANIERGHNGKPKVLFLYDFPIHGGGSGAYVKYLALRLVEKYRYKERIAVLVPDRLEIDPRIKQYNLKLPQIPIFIGRPGLEKSKKYAELNAEEIAELYKAFIDGTIRVVKDFRPDIIHVHHTMVNLWAARFIRSIFGTKYIATSHGSDIQAISKDRRYFRMTRDGLNAASFLTVVSGDTRAKLLKMFGTHLSAKTRTIPGGIRLSQFPANKNMERQRRQMGLSGKKMALFTGRLISEKGVEFLVKAARKINGQVIIAGDGPQRQKLAEMIEKMNIHNVTLLGFFADRQRIIDLYYLADVFVSPALWDEPLGLTIIEAMASKTPPVVTRKGGIVMAIKDGINGTFVRPRNATEIAKAVNYLFENTEVNKRMGEAARKTVEEKFTWTNIAQRFDKLYMKVVRNGHK